MMEKFKIMILTRSRNYEFFSNVSQFSVVCFYLYMNMHQNGIIKVFHLYRDHQFFSLYPRSQTELIYPNDCSKYQLCSVVIAIL